MSQTQQLLQQQFEKQMKASNLRVTHVRQKLFDVLLVAPRPLSIQELTTHVDNAHFASIYRSVAALHAAHIIKQVPHGFKYRYELGDIFKPHHHHATCEGCNLTREIRSPQLEQLLSQLAKQVQLTPTRHHFELYGLCSKCVELRQPD